MFAIIIVIIKKELADNLKNEIKIWTLDSVGEDLHFKLKIKIKTTTALIISNTVMD